MEDLVLVKSRRWKLVPDVSASPVDRLRYKTVSRLSFDANMKRLKTMFKLGEKLANDV